MKIQMSFLVVYNSDTVVALSHLSLYTSRFLWMQVFPASDILQRS